MRVLFVLLIFMAGLPNGASVYTQCGNDSFALHDSTTPVGELDRSSDPDNCCNCTSDSSGRVICASTHDYISKYKRACWEIGGIFFTDDFTERCNDTVNGTNVVVINTLSIQTPNCAARSCTELFDADAAMVNAMVKDAVLTYFYMGGSGCDIAIANVTIEHRDEVPQPSTHPITASTSGNIRGSFLSISWITVLASLAIALG
jgi:hypothetical protein